MASDEEDNIVRPTRERMRRAIGHDELVETARGGVTRKSGAVRVWSNLDNLLRNGIITPELYQAAQKYYADWYLALEAGRPITMRWSEYIGNANSGSAGMDAAERRVFHQKRFAQANKILEEMGRRKLIHWFVIEDIKPENIGRQYWGLRGKHTAAGRAVGAIETALHRLAVFYGLLK